MAYLNTLRYKLLQKIKLKRDNMNEIILSELVITKFCHDITGPIGAIGNGIDFLKEGKDTLQEQYLNLLESSSKDAISRLVFFRQAYGTLPATTSTNMERIQQISAEFFAQKKVQIDWVGHDSPAQAFHGPSLKLALNTLLFLSDTLPQGGKIQITIEENQDKVSVTATALGNHIKVEVEDKMLIQGDTSSTVTIDTRRVQTYLLTQLIKNMQASVTINVKNDSVSITIKS